MGVGEGEVAGLLTLWPGRVREAGDVAHGGVVLLYLAGLDLTCGGGDCGG